MPSDATRDYVLLLTIVAGWLGRWYVETRNRRWAREDARDRDEKLERAAARVAAMSADAHSRTLDALKENTTVSTEAFKEANHINRKLEALGLERNQLERERQE